MHQCHAWAPEARIGLLLQMASEIRMSIEYLFRLGTGEGKNLKERGYYWRKRLHFGRSRWH